MAVKKEIPEAKIRQVIWMLKVGKTKKACCEHLGIAYNTKRLDTIIEEFKAGLEREELLKKEARSKPLEDSAKSLIIDSYQRGEAISNIAESLYLTPQKIKQVLIEGNVPIRARSKKGEAKVDHVVQDLDKKFVKDEKVFVAKYNGFAIVKEIYDEEYLEQFDNAHLKSVELWAWSKLKPDEEPIEGVHYEPYYILDDGSQWKRSAAEQHVKRISKIIEETGRESYLVYHIGDYTYYSEYYRRDLFPVVGANNVA